MKSTQGRFEFERFVARRYLAGVQGGSESRKFVRIILYLAVGGVAVGVAALLLALAIVRGFGDEIEAKITGFGAHVQIESYLEKPLPGASGLAAKVRTLPGVESVEPVIIDLAMMRAGRDIEGISLWGTENPHRFVSQKMVEGEFTYAENEDGRAGVVVGKPLARLLGIELGQRITMFSTRGLNQNGGPAALLQFTPRVRQYYVAGIYETNLSEFDELFVFASIESARKLFGYNANEATRFDVLLDDYNDSRALSDSIETALGFPTFATSIFDLQRNLFAWVNLQQSIIPFIIGVIILVAAFNIVATLLMMILEKTGDIGILISMGATQQSLRRLFIWLGFLVSGTGTLFGIIIAVVLAWLQVTFGIIPLPADIYYMDTAPMDLQFVDIIIVSFIALVLGVTAAYIPAKVAARVDPLRAIRFGS